VARRQWKIGILIAMLIVLAVAISASDDEWGWVENVQADCCGDGD
tara:strand:- start:11808 stop:11942 length:135 start_codon:yes stop_codon:yes gene_type:complete